MKEKGQANHYFEMGLRLLQADDCHNAISLLSIAIDLDAHFGDAYGYRGLAYYTVGTYQEAMDDYNTALSLDPSLDKIFYFRGILHLQLTHYQEAVNDLTATIELENYFSEAYYHRGISKGLSGDPKGAIYDIKSAAQLGFRLAQKILNERGIVW
jgi:tetratricopeptide (TPR) repeat protein